MHMLSKYVCLATSEVEPAWEEEFGRWCDEERLPRLRRTPGCLSARRYVALDGGPKHLALWEIESIDADWNAAGPARLRPHVKDQFAIYRQTFPDDGVFHGAAWGEGATEAQAILVVRLDIAPEHDEEFTEWYSQEHLPALCAVPGVICGRIFEAVEGGPKHMTIFHLAVPEAQASEAWQRAASTPWTMRMRRLVPNRWRVVYRPLAS